MTPKIRKETRRGQTTWIVDYKKAGKRKRSRCATRADAERKHGELVEQLRDHGQIVMDITEPERRELHQVFAEAKRMGVSMRDVWAGYLAGGRGSVLPAITLGEAVKQLVAAKRAAKRALRYVDGLESYLTQFIAGRESVQVASITHADIEEWFNGRKDADSTKASDRFRISGLFSYCIRRGYLTVNPCAALETVSLVHGPPSVLTPEQCKAALAWARTRPLLPWLVLGLLCGLRPEEADQTTAAHVDLKAGWLTVDAQSSKVRQRRIVHLTPQAREWLKRCRKQDFTMTRQRRRRWMRSLRDELKLPRWPQDVLRHTFASFTMAEVQDAGKVAAEMGNSAGVLMRHYRELMTRDDAKRYRKAMAVPTSSPSRIPRGKPD